MILRLFFTWVLALYSFSLFANELGQLTPQQLESLQQQQKPLIIDIRTAKEWQQTGIIPNSHRLQSFDTQGHFDKDKWLSDLKKLQKNSKQPIVLVCHSGNRSGVVGKILIEKSGLKNIHHLSDGIKQWIKSGREITKNCHPKKAC